LQTVHYRIEKRAGSWQEKGHFQPQDRILEEQLQRS